MSRAIELPPGCIYGGEVGDVRGRVYWGSELISTGYTREQACARAWGVFDDGPDERGALRARIAELESEVDEVRRRLLCACGYVDLSNPRSELAITRLLKVKHWELPAILGDAENVNWICREDSE